MAASKRVQQAQATLAKNRRDAITTVQAKGVDATRDMLERSAIHLQKRLTHAEGLKGPGKDSFTATQLRTTLRQVTHVLKTVTGGLKATILDVGEDAAERSAGDTVDYLLAADKAFRGVGVQPLAIREALMMDRAMKGVNASILRRLASSGEPIEGADEIPHRAKLGILERYGVETIGVFEDTLQQGLLARKSWAEMRDDLIEQSPFLKGKPAHWAERIVRTEAMGAYNKAGWESVREADEQLGDMVKILSATFDDRTAADSYAVHGQIRRPDEPFESWFGLYMHPPNRPNDREIVVPHRIAWEIPTYLQWRTPAEIQKAWMREGRKGAPPERPTMTTVPLSSFGKPTTPRGVVEGEEGGSQEDQGEVDEGDEG